MATHRGRRRIARSDGGGQAPRPVPNGVQLAAGVRLVRAGSKAKLPVLACGDGKVQLNESAVAILTLCDGSRSREEIVAQVTSTSSNGALAADVEAFLDAARARGWIVHANSEHRD